jgi:hypothetical protein
VIAVIPVRRNDRFSQIFSRSTEHRRPRFSTETVVFVLADRWRGRRGNDRRDLRENRGMAQLANTAGSRCGTRLTPLWFEHGAGLRGPPSGYPRRPRWSVLDGQADNPEQ